MEISQRIKDLIPHHFDLSGKKPAILRVSNVERLPDDSPVATEYAWLDQEGTRESYLLWADKELFVPETETIIIAELKLAVTTKRMRSGNNTYEEIKPTIGSVAFWRDALWGYGTFAEVPGVRELGNRWPLSMSGASEKDDRLIWDSAVRKPKNAELIHISRKS